MHRGVRTFGALVALLAGLEFASGFLQGYYTPMFTDIARHLRITDGEVNWLEGAQLALSALVIPVFAKLGDLLGPRPVLLWATGATAIATLALPLTDHFVVFLAAWAVQGCYAAWLPLEIALLWWRGRERADRGVVTARAAGGLIAALEVGAIVGALVGGQLIDRLPLPLVLLVPGALTVIGFAAVALGVPRSAPHGIAAPRSDSTRDRTDGDRTDGARFDTLGLVLVSLAILSFTGGLGALRGSGPTGPLAWVLLAAALVLGAGFVRWELRHPDPFVDVALFREPRLAPVFITAALFGMSVLGAQAPASTFIRTDPSAGFGLGLTGFSASLVIGFYLIAMTAGALLFSFVARRIAMRPVLVTAALLVSIGFLLFVPLHMTPTQFVTNMALVGIGSGTLVAALPSLAAAGAPGDRTSVATGLTNATKTLGGAVASAVFGIALAHGVTEAAGPGATATAGAFSGYLVVWFTCAGAALVSAAVLLALPRARR